MATVETPPKSAYPERIDPQEIFVGLDFDRFLASVDKTYALLNETIRTRESYGGQELADVMSEAKEATENDGGSFNPVDFLKQQSVTDETINEILDDFVVAAQKNPEEYLEEGAVGLLKVLEEHRVNYGVITYTTSDLWSIAKIKGLLPTKIKHITTPETDKRELIRGWWDDERQEFAVPAALGGVAARWVLYGDDKGPVLEDFSADERMGGWWYVPSGDKGALLPSQQPTKSMPAHIIEIDRLTELTRDIQRVYQDYKASFRA